jgi:hypothetical protein
VPDVEQVENAIGQHDPGTTLAGTIQLNLKRYEIEDNPSHNAY